jgi:hypothetical protein
VSVFVWICVETVYFVILIHTHRIKYIYNFFLAKNNGYSVEYP